MPPSPKWCLRRRMAAKPFQNGPSADQVASRMKQYSEGLVDGRDFFESDRACYSEPFFRVSDAKVLSLLFGLMWLAISEVTYDVQSSFRTREGLFVVEADVTYYFRAPFSFHKSSTTVHVYHTVTIKPGSDPAAEAWRVTDLETVRESYALSVPARMLSAPLIQLLSAAYRLVRLVSSPFGGPSACEGQPPAGMAAERVCETESSRHRMR